MKKKVTMICTLKSGAVVEDSVKFDLDNYFAKGALDKLLQVIDKSVGYAAPAVNNIHFGTTTISTSEIAAITFKD